jgi:hypothetical protein
VFVRENFKFVKHFHREHSSCFAGNDPNFTTSEGDTAFAVRVRILDASTQIKSVPSAVATAAVPRAITTRAIPITLVAGTQPRPPRFFADARSANFPPFEDRSI